MTKIQDPLRLGGKEFSSRFLLGTGKFSLDKTAEVIQAGGVEIVTLALRRANGYAEEKDAVEDFEIAPQPHDLYLVFYISSSVYRELTGGAFDLDIDFADEVFDGQRR